MKLSYTNFAGIGPRIAPRLLPSNFGQIARNTKLWSGEIRPFFDDTFIKYVPVNTRSIYKYRHTSGFDVWLDWEDDVNVVKGPVFADKYNRIILSGSTGGLRVTDSTQLNITTSTIDSTNSYSLGIPAPTGITMAVSGTGTANLESRSYTVAAVREWSDGKLDVGPLSQPAVTFDGKTYVDVYSGQTVTISNITLPSDAWTEYRIRRLYIYRTTVGSAGDTAYSFVGEVSIVPGIYIYSFIDNVPTSSLGEIAVSTEWDTPISTLKGVISLNNGVLAAFDGTDVYFSYPYQPHAWPITYRVAVDYPIVGLGSFGSNVVICTEAAPALVLVSDPAAAAIQPIHENIPCLSARSIVSTAGGVIYATKNGLCRISSTQPAIITDTYFTRDEWLKWNPSDIMAAFYDSSYMAGFEGTLEDRDGGFIYDLDDPNQGIVTVTPRVKALWTDIEFGDLYVVRTAFLEDKWAIASFDTDLDSRRTFTWRSKIDTSTEGIATFSAARVSFDYGWYKQGPGFMPPFYRVTGEAPINSSLLCFAPLAVGAREPQDDTDFPLIIPPILTETKVTFKYFIDGVLRFTYDVKNSRPFRLPSGFRGSEIEIEVESNTPIHFIEIATSMAELQ